jgi:G3E family GTPase
LEIAPFTVDPMRAREVLRPHGSATLSEKITYIYKLQQMEADAIAINKTDLLASEQIVVLNELIHKCIGQKPIFDICARSGKGFGLLAAWLNRSAAASARSINVDYDITPAGKPSSHGSMQKFVCRPGSLSMSIARCLALASAIHNSLVKPNYRSHTSSFVCELRMRCLR